jgi:hypothetical protein
VLIVVAERVSLLAPALMPVTELPVLVLVEEEAEVIVLVLDSV